MAKSGSPLPTKELPPCGGEMTFEQKETFAKPPENGDVRSAISYRTYEALTALKTVAWILPVAFTYLWISAIAAMIPPFYPAMVTPRGMESWKIGFVFAAYKCGMCFGSPLSRKMITWLSPTKSYLLGQAGTLLSCLCLGSLYWVSGDDVLLWLSLLTMMVLGIFISFLIVTMFAAATSVYSSNPGVLYGILEAISGVGNGVGSAAGGALIDLWAFPLPFFVVGIVQALSSPFIVIYGVKSKETSKGAISGECVSKSQNAERIRGAEFWFLLMDIEFLVGMIHFAFYWIILAFNQATMEVHLSQFQLSSTHLGEIYMMQSGAYIVGSVLSAIFCNIQKERTFLMLGHVLAVVAYLILGPVPFIPIALNLWMASSAQVCLGIATAAYFVCSICHLQNTALSRGCPDNIQATSFVVSVTYGFAVFCACITAPIAGYVMDIFGYQTASMVLFAVFSAWTPVTLVLWLRPGWLRGKKTFRPTLQENHKLSPLS